MTAAGYLLERERGAHAEAAFLRPVRAGQVMLISLAAAGLDRMAELAGTCADFPLGLVDASVVAVAERLGADEIATLDHRHFSVVRPWHMSAFGCCPKTSD